MSPASLSTGTLALCVLATICCEARSQEAFNDACHAQLAYSGSSLIGDSCTSGGTRGASSLICDSCTTRREPGRGHDGERVDGNPQPIREAPERARRSAGLNAIEQTGIVERSQATSDRVLGEPELGRSFPVPASTGSPTTTSATPPENAITAIINPE